MAIKSNGVERLLRSWGAHKRGETIVFPRNLCVCKAFKMPGKESWKTRIARGVTIGRNVKVGNEFVTVGEGSQIGNNCKIDISDIGKKVKIGANTELISAEIGDETEIGPGGYLDNRVKIGKGVRVGHNFTGNKGFVIEDGAIIGKNVVLGTGVRRIGKGAVIEDNVKTDQEEIADGQRVQTKDAPNVDEIYKGPYIDSPHLPPKVQKIVGDFEVVINDYQEHMRRDTKIEVSPKAAEALSAEPNLFLYSQLHLCPPNKFVRIIGKKTSVIFYVKWLLDGSFPWGQGFGKYFGSEEIKPEYIAEERLVSLKERRRLARIARLMPGIIKAENACERGLLGMGHGGDKYAMSEMRETYVLFNYLNSKFNWESNKNLRFLDIGSGMGTVAKIANLFMPADGIENNRGRHRLARKYLPKGTGINLRDVDLFKFDISPYDVVYIYMEFPRDGNRIAAHIEGIPIPSFETPFAKQLRKKLEELKAGSLIIMGPQGSKRITSQILSNMEHLDLDIPPQVDDFEVFRRP